MAPIRLALPVHERDPVARLRLVRERTRRIANGTPVAGLMGINQVKRFVPTQLLPIAFRTSTVPSVVNLVVSNLVGPRAELSACGRPLRRLHGWTFLPAGHGLSVVMNTWRDAVTINVLADPGVVRDVRGFADDVIRTLEQIERAAVTVTDRGGAVPRGTCRKEP